jgi:hypothetical protein
LSSKEETTEAIKEEAKEETPEEFEKFVNSQLDLVKETNSTVVNNALAYHRERCKNPSPGCEDLFMELFFMCIEIKIGMRQSRRRRLPVAIIEL